MRSIRALIAASVLAGLTLAMTGCNTVRGIGKDIHDTAQNVQMALEGDSGNYAHLPPPETSRTAYMARP